MRALSPSAKQSVGVHVSPESGPSPGLWEDHAPAPPAGSVAVITLPASSVARHSLTVGQAIEMIRLSESIFALDQDVPTVGFVDHARSPGVDVDPTHSNDEGQVRCSSERMLRMGEGCHELDGLPGWLRL
ncbi:MAG: hypothetical protein ACLP01_19580 [Solirubrobacteraceae bacterium]